MAQIDPNMTPDQMAALALEFLRPQLRPDADLEACRAVLLSTIKACGEKVARMAHEKAQTLITSAARTEVEYAELIGGATASEILSHDIRIEFRL